MKEDGRVLENGKKETEWKKGGGALNTGGC